jgi:hypothetical protein
MHTVSTSIATISPVTAATVCDSIIDSTCLIDSSAVTIIAFDSVRGVKLRSA